jgi:hypothetical protein
LFSRHSTNTERRGFAFATLLRALLLCANVQHGQHLKVHLMGVVRGLSLVSRTKTASSFAGSVLLALHRARQLGPALACPIDARLAVFTFDSIAPEIT